MTRRLFPGHPSPLITEIPDQLLAVVYPERQIQCQFANRRVDVRDGRGLDPGTDPFAMIAINAIEAARHASGQDIIAYGYNFDVNLPLEGDEPAAFLRMRFLNQPQRLGEAFGGEVHRVGISASVQRGQSQANFEIAPLGDGTGLLAARVNYHYEPGQPPENIESLSTEVRDRYGEFLAALERL